MEPEILQVKLVESFSWISQVGVPFVVAFGATFLAHFLLKSQRKTETQKAKAEELLSLYTGFQARGLKALTTAVKTIKKYRSKHFKDFEIEKPLISDNKQNMMLRWLEVIAFYNAFEFCFGEELRNLVLEVSQEIQDLSTNIVFFVNNNMEKTKSEEIDHKIQNIKEIYEKLMASMAKFTRALKKEINRR